MLYVEKVKGEKRIISHFRFQISAKLESEQGLCALLLTGQGFGEEIATLRKERRGPGFWAKEDTVLGTPYGENTESFIDGITGPTPRLSSGHA